MAPPDRAEPRAPARLASRAILLWGGGIAAALPLLLAGLWWFEVTAAGDPRAGFAPPRPFPPPQLQSDPGGDWRRFRAGQEAGLGGPAWVDRERGLVRVPVERAMALIVARGADAYAPLQAPPPPDARGEAMRRAAGAAQEGLP